MSAFNRGYPFHFRNKKSAEKTDKCLVCVHLYTFVTFLKTRYLVHVEEYKNDIYALKFHDKNHSRSKKKYLLMTGERDARKVIKTVVDIGKHVLDKNELASFVFIGSPTIEEAKLPQNQLFNTKRFRVYKSFASFYFSNDAFEHKTNVDKSSYFILNRKKKNINPDIEKEVYAMFNEYYTLDDLYEQMISIA